MARFSWEEHEHPRSVLGRFVSKLANADAGSMNTLQDGSARVDVEKSKQGGPAYTVKHKNGKTSHHREPKAAARAALDASARNTGPESLGPGTASYQGVEGAIDAHKRELGKGPALAASKGRFARTQGSSSVSSAPAEGGGGGDKRPDGLHIHEDHSKAAGYVHEVVKNGKVVARRRSSNRYNYARWRQNKGWTFHSGRPAGGQIQAEHPDSVKRKNEAAVKRSQAYREALKTWPVAELEVALETNRRGGPAFSGNVKMIQAELDSRKGSKGKTKLEKATEGRLTRSGSDLTDVKAVYKVTGPNGEDLGVIRQEKEYERVMEGRIQVGKRTFGTFWYHYPTERDAQSGRSGKRTQRYTRADALAEANKLIPDSGSGGAFQKRKDDIAKAKSLGFKEPRGSGNMPLPDSQVHKAALDFLAERSGGSGQRSDSIKLGDGRTVKVGDTVWRGSDRYKVAKITEGKLRLEPLDKGFLVPWTALPDKLSASDPRLKPEAVKALSDRVDRAIERQDFHAIEAELTRQRALPHAQELSKKVAAARAKTDKASVRVKMTPTHLSDAEGSDISVEGSDSGYDESIARAIKSLKGKSGTVTLSALAAEEWAGFLDAMAVGHSQGEHPATGAAVQKSADKIREDARAARLEAAKAKPGVTKVDRKAALEFYHSPKAFDLNENLRKGKSLTPEQQAVSDALDSGMTTSSSPKTLFRGLDDADKIGVRSGKTITDKGFMSTSANADSADDFGWGISGSNPVVLKISVPQGTRTLDVPAGDYGDQAETLLPRGTSLQIGQEVGRTAEGTPILEAKIVSVSKPVAGSGRFPSGLQPGEGPSTHTGWLGRYRKMSADDLVTELASARAHEAAGKDFPKPRRGALLSAIAEAKGEKQSKARPGAKKEARETLEGKTYNQLVTRWNTLQRQKEGTTDTAKRANITARQLQIAEQMDKIKGGGTQFDRDQADLNGMSEYQRAVYRRMRDSGYTHKEALQSAQEAKGSLDKPDPTSEAGKRAEVDRLRAELETISEQRRTATSAEEKQRVTKRGRDVSQRLIELNHELRDKSGDSRELARARERIGDAVYAIEDAQNPYHSGGTITDVRLTPNGAPEYLVWWGDLKVEHWELKSDLEWSDKVRRSGQQLNTTIKVRKGETFQDADGWRVHGLGSGKVRLIAPNGHAVGTPSMTMLQAVNTKQAIERMSQGSPA